MDLLYIFREFVWIVVFLLIFVRSVFLVWILMFWIFWELVWISFFSSFLFKISSVSMTLLIRFFLSIFFKFSLALWLISRVYFKTSYPLPSNRFFIFSSVAWLSYLVRLPDLFYPPIFAIKFRLCYPSHSFSWSKY